MVREARASLDRDEVDLRVAAFTDSLVTAAAPVAGTTPEAGAMVTELRAWVRDVLADRAEARVPDMANPSVLHNLVEALPAREPVVLSKRLRDHLYFVLTVPWERDRRGVELIDDPPG